MVSRFFINRPIFAAVISILIVIAGAVSIFRLPISQYPEITPPTIHVEANYPGADPKVVAETVAEPIEQEVNGVENMLYMSSTSASNGNYALRVTFDLGTDIDMAAVLVQNRVSRALAKLPQDVQRQGVTTKKSSTSLVNVISFYSSDGRRNDLFLTNYITLHIKDEITRIPGVGEVSVFPSKDYAMRIWVNPNRLEARGLTANDVVDAVRQQNVQVAAGQIGQPPAPKGQDFQLTVNMQGRLTEAEQFTEIVVKTGEGGRITRLKDVARVDLGGKTYDTFSVLNGTPAGTMLVYQSPGSNALAVADRIRKKMEELKERFPQGLEYTLVYDNSEFVRASIHEVVLTLFEAFCLVFLVVLIFLQDWRATLIPVVTIPVSLIGTFAVMAIAGFSINMTTLFGLVLAIGIVVDDAIVVVENVDRNMTHLGLAPKDAAIRAMGEITRPIISTTLVLMAVFVPAAFLGGITGQLYRQFSLTIAVSTLFSAVNALTLSPALCALVMRPHQRERSVFFRAFNRAFDRLTGCYTSTVSFCVRRVFVMALVFAGLLVLTYAGFVRVPTGFVPTEDDGLIVVNMQLPDGASLQRTRAVVERVGEILKETAGVENCVTLGGFSVFDGNAPNLAAGFAPLVPWDERLKEGRSKWVIMRELNAEFAKIQEAIVFAFSFPPIRGLGTGSGFEMQVQDRGDVGLTALEKVAEELARDGTAQAKLGSVISTFRANVPTVFADVDRVKALKLGVPLDSLFDTMQTYLGSMYVNDFNKFGRTWQVMVQADSTFRATADDIKRLEVRNKQGKMVPLGTVVKVQDALGPPRIDRYNMYPSARVTGSAAAGASSGEALAIMEQMAAVKLPRTMGYEWTGVAYQEKKAGAQAVVVFALAVVVAILILAAQYESWTDPFAVVLIVPLAVLGAVVALIARHTENNLYTQVGLVLLVGLSAKNGILIVEFARHIRSEGKSVLEAAVEAARIRLRPILMTSFAFIIGVTPLVVATGAGAVSRQALGTAVFGGMLGVTLLGIVFTPVLYVIMQGPVTALVEPRIYRRVRREESSDS